jgi:hypothetical protein
MRLFRRNRLSGVRDFPDGRGRRIVEGSTPTTIERK